MTWLLFGLDMPSAIRALVGFEWRDGNPVKLFVLLLYKIHGHHKKNSTCLVASLQVGQLNSCLSCPSGSLCPLGRPHHGWRGLSPSLFNSIYVVSYSGSIFKLSIFSCESPTPSPCLLTFPTSVSPVGPGFLNYVLSVLSP